MTEHLDGSRELVAVDADATILQVHDLLADTYLATQEDRAGSKLQVVHNATGELIEQLDISDKRSHESDCFRNGSWLEGR